MKKLIMPMLLAAVATGASAVEPMWVRDVKLSPDGSKVAFVYKGAIYSVPSSGGNAEKLTSGEHYDCTPVWSPDGKKIAFSSDRNGGTDIYVMGADGSNPKRLTWNSAAETPEAFTPDGSKVIFSRPGVECARSCESEQRTIHSAGGWRTHFPAYRHACRQCGDGAGHRYACVRRCKGK